MANIDRSQKTLFPMLDRKPAGLARLAADATHTADGHLIEFKALTTRSVLNQSLSRRQLSLSWSINPYRGCEFACRYCYARYTHEFLEPGPLALDDSQGVQPWATAFERRIYLKQNAAWLLEQELRKIDPLEEIALGTATDPYQPIERTAKITRSLLEVFARRSGHRLGIVTKSTLITRDIDLLTQIARRNTLVLHVTITTPDTELARLIEPRAPRPDLRLGTVYKLRESGLTAGILCSPLLPGITDSAEAIDIMGACASQANASFFAAQPLFLKSCSRPTYLNFIGEHFPHLSKQYAQQFAQGDFAEKRYREELEGHVRDTCRRYRLSERSSDALLTRDCGTAKKPPVPEPEAAQALLFG